MDYNYEIIYAIASILDTYSISKLLSVFLGSSFVSEKRKRISYMLFYFVTTFSHWFLTIPISMALISIGGLLFLSFCYQCSIWKRILSVSFIFTILCSVETLVVLISGYRALGLFEQGTFASISGIVIIKILTYVIALILDKFKSIRSGIDVPISYWFCLFFVPSSSIFILFQSLNFEMLTYNMLTIEIVLFLVINLSVFYLYDRLAAKVTESAEHQIRLQEQAGYIRQYEIMKTSMESIKGLSHDLRNLFMTLHTLVESGNNEELINYIEEMESITQAQKSYIETKNTILDSILNYKIFEAESKGIVIVPDIIFPADIKLDAYDLTVILGNLLDNAIEASGCREIRITIRYIKGCMTIKVLNGFEGTVFYDTNGRIESKKQELCHGLGISNVERVIEKYNGMMELKENNQMFTAFVLLYIE